MGSNVPWHDGVRQVMEQSFTDPWDLRVAQFNHRPAVAATKTRFWLPRPGHPPAWFNGDIEALRPGEWVLVVSINPHINPDAPVPHTDDGSPQAWWDYWRTFNRHPSNWSGSFFPDLVTLAAKACGEAAPQTDADVHEFATTRMLFVEFCPYASNGWPSIPWESHMKPLAGAEVGFQIARRIRRHIFDYGQPRLVLCNGQYATWDVKDQQFGINRMYRMAVELLHQRGPEAFVYEGVYTPKVGAPFRVLGFNQLTWRTRDRDVVRSIIAEMGQRGSESPALVSVPRPEDWETAPPDQ